jgi:hypothetical protein
MNCISFHCTRNSKVEIDDEFHDNSFENLFTTNSVSIFSSVHRISLSNLSNVSWLARNTKVLKSRSNVGKDSFVLVFVRFNTEFIQLSKVVVKVVRIWFRVLFSKSRKFDSI